MAIMTGRVTARIGSGRGGAVRAKEGRGQIPAFGSSILDFCPPDDNSRSVNSPYCHIQTIAKYPYR